MPSVLPTAPKSDARLLLVSNRLPITINRSVDGTYDFSMSSGGLVSGLSGLSKSTTFRWYGWPGLEVPEAEAGTLVKRLKDEYNAVPVFIDDELADKHYNGFSSMPPRFDHTRLRLLTGAPKTPFYGHYFTIIRERLPLMNLRGTPTMKQTGCLLKRSLKRPRTVTLFGCTITI